MWVIEFRDVSKQGDVRTVEPGMVEDFPDRSETPSLMSHIYESVRFH